MTDLESINAALRSNVEQKQELLDRLIADNGELFTALKELLSLVPMCEINDPTRWFAACRARAIIAKEEGREP